LKFAHFGFITAPRVLISFQRVPSTKKVWEPLAHSVLKQKTFLNILCCNELCSQLQK